MPLINSPWTCYRKQRDFSLSREGGSACIISEGKRMQEVVREERVYPEQAAAARIDITKVKGSANSLFVHTGDASGKDYVMGASLS